VYDPRLPASHRGHVASQIALNIDIAPTILSLAGVEAPSAMQGVDLSSLLGGRAGLGRSDFFYEHLFVNRPGGKGPNLIPQSEGVVSLRYKYLRYIEQEPAFEQLFDLESDPREHRNLAAEPDRQGLLNAMRARWQELRAECL
jgi:arylsulfatase A-like enzyme